MLEKFQTGHHIIAASLLCSGVFGCLVSIIHGDVAFKRMQTRYLQGCLSHVDADDFRTTLSHGLTEDAAAAANIQDRRPFQGTAFVDPVESGGIYFM
jgi:hypothetical protein